jgi:hypothetical protein
MEWWVWVIIGFVVIGLFGDDSNAQLIRQHKTGQKS